MDYLLYDLVAGKDGPSVEVFAARDSFFRHVSEAAGGSERGLKHSTRFLNTLRTHATHENITNKGQVVQ